MDDAGDTKSHVVGVFTRKMGLQCGKIIGTSVQTKVPQLSDIGTIGMGFARAAPNSGRTLTCRKWQLGLKNHFCQRGGHFGNEFCVGSYRDEMVSEPLSLQFRPRRKTRQNHV